MKLMWDTLIYNPIYNLVIFLANYITDVGLVVVVATIVIKIILFPLYNKQFRIQLVTAKFRPEIEEINKKYKGRKLTPLESRTRAMEMMEIYKKYNINPLAPFLILIIQIPILFALYWVFYKGGLPEVNKEILYSFINEPKNLSMNFLGYFDMTKASVILAFIAAWTQLLYSQVSMPDVKLKDYKKPKGEDLKEDMINSLNVNIKYGLPVLVFITLLVLHSVAAVYWITSNIFMTLQYLYIKNKSKGLEKKVENKDK